MAGPATLFSIDYDTFISDMDIGAGMGSSTSAPIIQNLKGYQGVDGFAPDQTKMQLINVVHDFEWTHTPAHGRHEVPYIRMSEMKVKFNSIRQQLRYMLTGTGDGSVGGDALGSVGDWAAEALGIGGEDEGASTKEGEDKAKAEQLLKDVSSGVEDFDAIQRHLKSYFGLYGVNPTGFEYVFPYLTEAHKDVRSNWSSVEGSSQGGALSPLIDQIAGESGFIQDVINTAAVQDNVVGTYINRPKMYATEVEGPSITFGLDLFNTVEMNDPIRNWHLCFLLSYMNLPNQKSRTQIDPPVIYEVEVPGVFYSPFAYISNLSITHRGSTRTMTIPYYTNYDEIAGGATTEEFSVTSEASWHRFSEIQKGLNRGTYARKVQSYEPGINKKLLSVQNDPIVKKGGIVVGNLVNKTMTIPDAYHIDITLTSLIPESQNLYFHSILGNKTRGQGLYNVSLRKPETQRPNSNATYVEPYDPNAPENAESERRRTREERTREFNSPLGGNPIAN